jgi:hypothetical protein
MFDDGMRFRQIMKSQQKQLSLKKTYMCKRGVGGGAGGPGGFSAPDLKIVTSSQFFGGNCAFKKCNKNGVAIKGTDAMATSQQGNVSATFVCFHTDVAF